MYFFKFSLLVLLKKFVISPENRKKKQIKQKNQRKQFKMTFPRICVSLLSNEQIKTLAGHIQST